MRIVAGSARGRPLLGPKGPGLRPTADRVRETVFNVLGQWCDGLEVLDLFAGTGALALEALSRGAKEAVLVDSGKEAQRLCEANAAALGFAAQVSIWPQPVDKAAVALGRAGRSFDLVFADPPYAAQVVKAVIDLVDANRLLRPEGVLVVEHDKREEAPPTQRNFRRVDERRFGDTVVSWYRTCSP